MSKRSPGPEDYKRLKDYWALASRFMEETGMSQQQLAGLLAVSRGAISQYKAGITCPTEGRYRNLVELVARERPHLLGKQDDPYPPPKSSGIKLGEIARAVAQDLDELEEAHQKAIHNLIRTLPKKPRPAPAFSSSGEKPAIEQIARASSEALIASGELKAATAPPTSYRPAPKRAGRRHREGLQSPPEPGPKHQ